MRPFTLCLAAAAVVVWTVAAMLAGLRAPVDVVALFACAAVALTVLAAASYVLSQVQEAFRVGQQVGEQASVSRLSPHR